MGIRNKLLATGLFGCILGTAIGQAADWTQFRGPDTSGVAPDSKPSAEWGKDSHIAWKTAIPGVGWASPIVVGDKVFITTAVSEKQTKPKAFGGGGGGFPKGGMGGGSGGGFQKGGGGFPKGGMGGGSPPDVVYRWEVYCLDRTTGAELWKKTACEKKPTIPIHSTNTYASETPVSDGERIYAYFGMHGVYCFDLTGKPVWNMDLGSFKMQMGWGTGSSPVLDGDLLFIKCDNEEKSFVVALDKKTGVEKWRKNRLDKSSWSSPIIWKTKDRTELVCAGGTGVVAYEPKTGEVLWELKYTGRGAGSNATPVVGDGLLFCGSSSNFGSTPLYAIKPGAKGDITPKETDTSTEFIAWMVKGAAPSMSSPLVYQGCVYVVDQRGGTISCFDAKTGKEHYRKERLTKAKGITSSPWGCDGKVFCLDEDGQTFVVQAGKEFKLLGTNKLDEMFWSSPAIVGNNIFLRGTDSVYCVK